MAEKAQKLESYVWEGKDRKGNKAKGELTGSNLALVKAQLRKQGIIPDKVKKKPKPLFGGKKKITPFDIAMLTRQLATMMKAGVPLVQSFDIVADGLENKGLQELVMSIRNDISSGTGFASALRKHPNTLTIFIATWWSPARKPVPWSRCWTELPRISRKLSCSKRKLKRQ